MSCVLGNAVLVFEFCRFQGYFYSIHDVRGVGVGSTVVIALAKDSLRCQISSDSNQSPDAIASIQ